MVLYDKISENPLLKIIILSQIWVLTFWVTEVAMCTHSAHFKWAKRSAYLKYAFIISLDWWTGTDLCAVLWRSCPSNAHLENCSFLPFVSPVSSQCPLRSWRPPWPTWSVTSRGWRTTLSTSPRRTTRKISLWRRCRYPFLCLLLLLVNFAPCVVS